MRGEPMTFSQRRYIGDLIAECKKRGMEVPFELLEEVKYRDITKQRASEIIDELKFELGLGRRVSYK